MSAPSTVVAGTCEFIAAEDKRPAGAFGIAIALATALIGDSFNGVRKAMRSVNPFSRGRREWLGAAFEGTDAIQGTIQRVDYRRQEVRVIAQGRLWKFVLAADCRLWFNGTPCILRCFHPLDPVTIYYRPHHTEHIAQALYGWEPQRRTDA